MTPTIGRKKYIRKYVEEKHVLVLHVKRVKSVTNALENCVEAKQIYLTCKAHTEYVFLQNT